jgi:hypothetical protein
MIMKTPTFGIFYPVFCTSMTCFIVRIDGAVIKQLKTKRFAEKKRTFHEGIQEKTIARTTIEYQLIFVFYIACHVHN